MTFSSKQISLALIPKCTGLVSLMGSAFIFQDVIRSHTRRSRVYHRLLLGLSVFDMMASIVNFFSTWPIPAGTANVFAASGTTQTCTAQGFFNETGNVCTPLYNASLCAYYMLVIRAGWSEKQVKKVEPILHAIPLIIGWGMGIVGLPLNLYNPSGWLCWIAPYPSGCHLTGTCTRGELANLFRWIHYGIIWSAILFVTVGMFLIYWTVLGRERAEMQAEREAKMNSVGTEGELEESDDEEQARVPRRRFNSRKVALQSLLFVLALYLTWTFTTLTRIFQIVEGKTYYPLLVLMAFFFPLQGFFNFLIYLRPRFLRCSMMHPELPAFERCWMVLMGREESKATHSSQQASCKSEQGE